MGEREVDRSMNSLAPLTTVERVRAATAAAIARQALDMIVQDATEGRAIRFTARGVYSCFLMESLSGRAKWGWM